MQSSEVLFTQGPKTRHTHTHTHTHSHTLQSNSSLNLFERNKDQTWAGSGRKEKLTEKLTVNLRNKRILEHLLLSFSPRKKRKKKKKKDGSIWKEAERERERERERNRGATEDSMWQWNVKREMTNELVQDGRGMKERQEWDGEQTTGENWEY